MTTLLSIFISAMLFSLLLTPLFVRAAKRFGLMDKPSERKMHVDDIPRGGGMAIFASFFLPFALLLLFPAPIFDFLKLNREMVALVAGAAMAFGMGLWDDFKGLPPPAKLAIQVVAGLIAFAGGLRIVNLYVPMVGGIDLGILALPATVLWFLLVMNGINLIDGLDGLAAGVSLFVSIVLLAMCVMTGRHLEAMGFAALGGACLGFLRYNFNPATVFMGDCGSYFLGYMLAGLSLMGSIKSQATAALLIPIVALGVPIMDVLWAPVRRFVQGRDIFQADTGHFHHRLVRMGFSHRRAVLVLYGVTVGLGLLAIGIVHARDDRAALILLLMGLGVFFGFRKLGYLEYLAADKVYGWVKDVTDEMGISQERRSFLSIQMEISQAATPEKAWEKICEGLERLKFDWAEMRIERPCAAPGDPFVQKCTWVRAGSEGAPEKNGTSLLKMELPLFDERRVNLGTLWLAKDVSLDPIGHYTLRRVEHLRRTVTGAIQRLLENCVN